MCSCVVVIINSDMDSANCLEPKDKPDKKCSDMKQMPSELSSVLTVRGLKLQWPSERMILAHVYNITSKLWASAKTVTVIYDLSLNTPIPGTLGWWSSQERGPVEVNHVPFAPGFTLRPQWCTSSHRHHPASAASSCAGHLSPALYANKHRHLCPPQWAVLQCPTTQDSF